MRLSGDQTHSGGRRLFPVPFCLSVRTTVALRDAFPKGTGFRPRSCFEEAWRGSRLKQGQVPVEVEFSPRQMEEHETAQHSTAPFCTQEGGGENVMELSLPPTMWVLQWMHPYVWRNLSHTHTHTQQLTSGSLRASETPHPPLEF